MEHCYLRTHQNILAIYKDNPIGRLCEEALTPSLDLKL